MQFLKKITLSAIIIAAGFLQLQAQNVRFTSKDLPAQLKIFFQIDEKKISKNKEMFQKDSVINAFGNIYSGLDETQQKKHTKKINTLYARGAGKDKTLFNYIETMVLLQSQNKGNYKAWESYLNSLTSSKRTPSSKIKQFINQTFGLLKNDALYSTKTYNWKAVEANFDFLHDRKSKSFIVQIHSGNLQLLSPDKDTITVRQVKGKYNMTRGLWYGNSGKITWQKYDIPETEVYARLSKYQIKMQEGKIEVDSVMFYNKELINQEILGKLKHKASHYGFKNGLYPYFSSYAHNYTVKSTNENIKFRSGISMRGKTIEYTGSKSTPATAEYSYKGKRLFSAYAELFKSEDKKLFSPKAAVALYFNQKDSISHPAVNLKVKDTEISLTRFAKGAGHRPFYISYQKMFTTSNSLIFNAEDTIINFYSKEGNDAIFKSLDYFTKADFEKLRMHDKANPLLLLKKYSDKLGDRSFFAKDYAAHIRQDPVEVKNRLIGLWHQGFLEYNSENEYVTLNQKLFDNILYFFEKKDYDVINILSKGVRMQQNTSISSYKNAALNLKSNTLQLYGVEQVVLSQRNKIGFVPAKKTLEITANRDILFAGRLRAGLTDFYGKNFRFNYKDYNIGIEKADSLIFRVWENGLKEAKDDERPTFLTSVIEGVTGTLEIDSVNNKSGAKANALFPKLICSDTSYVFYDKKTEGGHAYNRKSFRFINYPFTQDSLLYLSKNQINIKGTMESGKLFPNFEDTLRVQEDYSLGFIHSTGEKGIKMFNGAATLSSQNNEMQSFIRLNNKGMYANGIAKWNNTKIVSEEFKLFPDSLSANAEEIAIKQDDKHIFPEVKGSKIQTLWDATKDEISYQNTEEPFDMYGGKSKFTGKLKYKVNSLMGEGTAQVAEGDLNAKEFLFKDSLFFSPNSQISIKDKDTEEQHLIVKNMRTYIDLRTQKAVFQSNDEFKSDTLTNDSISIASRMQQRKSYMEFINNKYLCYPNHLTWDIGKGRVNVGKNIERDSVLNQKMNKQSMLNEFQFKPEIFKNPEQKLTFISTHIDRDSLTFTGSTASYVSGEQNIKVQDVQKIIVADIEVTPSDEVIIKGNGEMENLLNATIKAGERHVITQVDMYIAGSDKYTATSGIYKYEDMNKTLQDIQFDNITYSSDKKASIAHGTVEQGKILKLNPWFDFYGDVNFNATEEFLNFDGYAKIKHNCPTANRAFYFKASINPDSIYLPLSPKLHTDESFNKARTFADILISKDSTHLFPAFLTNDPYGTSWSLLSLRDSSYFITFNAKKQKYEISTLERFQDPERTDNYLSLGTESCNIYGEGNLTFSQNIKIDSLKASGNLSFDLQSKKFGAQSALLFDFFFNKKSLDILSEKFASATNLSPIDASKKSYQRLLTGLLGKEQSEEIQVDFAENLDQTGKMPKDFVGKLAFTNLFFKWDQASESFKSSGKIGVLSIDNKLINNYVNGYIQILKKRSGDQILIYLEPQPEEWFFFSFSGGIMRTFSSVSDYNRTIEKLKTRKKRKKTKKGTFNYMLTNEEIKNRFIYYFTGKHPANLRNEDFEITQTPDDSTQTQPAQVQDQNFDLDDDPTENPTEAVDTEIPSDSTQTQNFDLDDDPTENPTEAVDTETPSDSTQTQPVQSQEPAAETQAVPESVTTPVNQTETPSDSTQAQPVQDQEPAAETQAVPESVTTPVNQAETPSDSTQTQPAQAQEPATETQAVPESVTTPVNQTETPSDSTQAQPVQAQEPATETQAVPESVTTPVNQSETPSDSTQTQPMQAQEPATETQSVPESVTTPVNQTETPSDSTQTSSPGNEEPQADPFAEEEE